MQKVQRNPTPNVMSAKDRIATSRPPELDPKELGKILATPPPGAPAPSGPRMQQPATQQPPVTAQNQQSSPQPQPGQQGQQQPNSPNQTAQLQVPAQPSSNNNQFSKYAAAMTPGAQIQEAARGAAARRGRGQEGDFGLGTGAHGRQTGALHILRDTQGPAVRPSLHPILHNAK